MNNPIFQHFINRNLILMIHKVSKYLSTQQKKNCNFFTEWFKYCLRYKHDTLYNSWNHQNVLNPTNHQWLVLHTEMLELELELGNSSFPHHSDPAVWMSVLWVLASSPNWNLPCLMPLFFLVAHPIFWESELFPNLHLNCWIYCAYQGQ